MAVLLFLTHEPGALKRRCQNCVLVLVMDPQLTCVLVCPLWCGVCASSSAVLSICYSQQFSSLKGKSHGPTGNTVPMGDLTPVFVVFLTRGIVAHPLLSCLPRAQVLPVWSS